MIRKDQVKMKIEPCKNLPLQGFFIFAGGDLGYRIRGKLKKREESNRISVS